jgi:hypothetical protein
MSSPAINEELLETIVDHHDRALKAIYVMSLLIELILVLAVADRWDLKSELS